MENGKSICAAEKEAKIEEFSSGLPSFCSLLLSPVLVVVAAFTPKPGSCNVKINKLVA